MIIALSVLLGFAIIFIIFQYILFITEINSLNKQIFIREEIIKLQSQTISLQHNGAQD